jgi:hypothetical protein
MDGFGAELVDERIVRSGFVRDVSFGVRMTMETARGLREWLSDKIETLESLHEDEEDTRND